MSNTCEKSGCRRLRTEIIHRIRGFIPVRLCLEHHAVLECEFEAFPETRRFDLLKLSWEADVAALHGGLGQPAGAQDKAKSFLDARLAFMQAIRTWIAAPDISQGDASPMSLRSFVLSSKGS